MTTDDEIRAAERRLRAYSHGDHRAYDKPLEPHEIDLDKVERDRRVIVAAYLNPWRPISSAPRDGTRVLLWWDGWDIQLGSWHPLHGWAVGPIVRCQPTHWTPLPLPPA